MNYGSIKRFVGKVLYTIVGKHLPASHFRYGGVVGRRIRGFCARLMLDFCGSNVNVERMATFSSRIRLGSNSGIGSNAIISAGTVIGDDVMMGPYCTIYTRNHRFDRTDIPMLAQGFQDEKPVLIGDDVWIGGNVTILPGISVGKSSIIGAGAVVTKDIPAYAIVVGNPARIVKYRNSPNKQTEI